MSRNNAEEFKQGKVCSGYANYVKLLFFVEQFKQTRDEQRCQNFITALKSL